MEIMLDLSIFRFDKKTDYLPYYKKYNVAINAEKTLDNLLSHIKENDTFFDFPSQSNSYIKINNHILSTKTTINEINKFFGNLLILDPLSKKRAIKDLIIDETNFYDTLKLISPFITEEDRTRFDSYKKFYYASSMLKYKETFQGTSLFLFVNELINKNSEHKEELLKIISNEENGIWYHTPLCHKIYPQDDTIEDIIINLKREILSLSIKLSKAL